MIQFSKISVVVLTGLLAFFLPVPMTGQENDMAGSENPITVVQQFYQAIKEQRCKNALDLRPGYTEEQCREVKEVNDVDVIRHHSIISPTKGGLAFIELKVKIRKADKQESWHGFLKLEKRGNHWKIVNDSYLSQKKIENFDAYLASRQYQAIDQPSTSTPAIPASIPERPEVVTPEPSQESSAEPVSGIDSALESAVPKPAPAITSPPPTVAPPLTVAPSTPSPSQRQELGRTALPRTGATTLLQACWGPDELRGSPGERTLHDRPADYSPPERVYPQWSNEPLEDKWARSIRFVNPAHGEKLVALTFDLCEQANERTGYDGEIVNILRAEKVNATFFAGGKWMRSHPQRAMQLMADPLFEIGNHAWTHGNLRVLRGKEMTEQIQWTQAQYELLREQLLKLPCAASVGESRAHRIPPLPTTFRFPYGACDATALKAVAQAGLYPIQWNVISGDPARGQTAELMIKGILDKMRPGSIVIAHANGRGWHTGEALRTLIPALRKQGYRFVTVSQLLKSGTPVAVESCYEVRPGDNLRYDQLFGRGTE